MTRFTSPLERLNIASPCTASWDDMTGDMFYAERVRKADRLPETAEPLMGNVALTDKELERYY